MSDDRARAITTRGALRLECAIRTTIHADPERVWRLLTTLSEVPRWNSTIATIEGEIAEGQVLRLTVPAAGTRVFKPRVSHVVAARLMVWSDGAPLVFQGVRTFSLTPAATGATDFAMREVFRGFLLPVIKPSLPDFRPIFETYAADLKRAAETPT